MTIALLPPAFLEMFDCLHYNRSVAISMVEEVIDEESYP